MQDCETPSRGGRICSVSRTYMLIKSFFQNTSINIINSFNRCLLMAYYTLGTDSMMICAVHLEASGQKGKNTRTSEKQVKL